LSAECEHWLVRLATCCPPSLPPERTNRSDRSTTMPSRQNHYNNSLRLNFATEKESRRNYPTAKSLYKLGPPTLRQFLLVHNTRSALGFGYDLASICFTGVHFMKLLNLN